MCSRYRVKNNVAVIVHGKTVVFDYKARYNAAPAQDLPAIYWDGMEAKGVQMKWGWKPAWSKSLLINAQAETVLEKPTFKRFIHQRCLIPADGFYEWTATKQPIMFTKANDEQFCFAGLWMEQEAEKQFLILTTTPNDSVRSVHNRMPLIVPKAQYGSWLDNGEEFKSILANPDKEELNSVPVQRELNNVKNDRPELIQPVLVQKELL